MDFLIRALGLILTVHFGQEEAEEAADESYRLGTSDHSFGFGPDPLVEPYWTDDIDG